MVPLGRQGCLDCPRVWSAFRNRYGPPPHSGPARARPGRKRRRDRGPRSGAVTPVDPFGTVEMRRKHLQTWQDNPARYREDANTEEYYARGYYSDRLIIELAQNRSEEHT